MLPIQDQAAGRLIIQEILQRRPFQFQEKSAVGLRERFPDAGHG
jgi:hypothetical protein